MTVTKSRSGLLAVIFVLTTFALSWSFLWVVNSGLPLPGWALPLVLMWIPGLVSIACRLKFHEGFEDAGFNAGKLRYWVIAYAVPFALATATYLLAWLFQQVSITPYLKQQSMYGPLPFRLVWFDSGQAVLVLLVQRLAVVMTLGITVGFVFALGEEIGWRGYLLPRLIKANVRFPVLLSGIIWAVWHVPFVLLTFQHQPCVTAVLYSLLCVVFAVFIGWLRLVSGSVLVAGMAHAAYNAFYQDFYDHSFVGPYKWFWAGEVGLLCSVVFGVFALWLYRTNRIAPLLQAARTEPTQESRVINGI